MIHSSKSLLYTTVSLLVLIMMVRSSDVRAKEKGQANPVGTTHLSQAQSDSSLSTRRLTGHTNPVAAFAFSSDSSQLATGGGQTINIWNTANSESNNPLLRVEAVSFPDSLTSIALSPSGQTLASASILVGDIKLWDVQTGEVIRVLQGHDSMVSRIVFSPDGSTLVSASSDETIKIWNVQTGEVTRSIQVSQPSDSLSFSPDGRLIASSGYYDKSNLIRLWNIDTGSLVRTFQGPDEGINDIAFSPNGQILASANSDSTITLWNVQNGTIIRTLEGHTRGVTSISFVPDGNLLASGSFDGTVRMWNVETGASGVVVNRGIHIRDIIFSPNGEFLAFNDVENSILLLGPASQ